MYNLPFWFSDGKIAKIVPTMIYRAGRLLRGAVNSPGALSSGVALLFGKLSAFLSLVASVVNLHQRCAAGGYL